MARKAQLTNVILTYIARDDSAIGVPAEELDEKYNEYLRTKDLSTLQIDYDKSPCIYTLRTFSTQKHNAYVAQAIDALQSVMPNGDAASIENVDVHTLSRVWDQYDLYIGLAIKDRIIGVSNHPMVAEVTANGEVREVVVQWTPGQPEPAGLIEDILSQRTLAREIFQFLVTAASLTDRQKKA